MECARLGESWKQKHFTRYPSSPRVAAADPPASPVPTTMISSFRRLFGLTNRELEAVRALSRGGRYEAICKQLRISRPTLRTHLRAAYAKVGCRDRVELILTLVHRERSNPSAAIASAVRPSG